MNFMKAGYLSTNDMFEGDECVTVFNWDALNRVGNYSNTFEDHEKSIKNPSLWPFILGRWQPKGTKEQLSK